MHKIRTVIQKSDLSIWDKFENGQNVFHPHYRFRIVFNIFTVHTNPDKFENEKTKRGIGPRSMAEHAHIITGARTKFKFVFVDA